ncbi:hypothetical protein KFE25_009576 [Diacronema lutheri]|nr:hypothetical protein KFE25_009576 [Diacronema lutheri]
MPACLPVGFARRRVPGQPYPGLVKSTTQAVGATHGLLLADLVDAERAILDAFEGDAYEQQPVEARLVRGVDAPYAWATASARRDASALTLSKSETAAVAYLWRDAAALQPELWAPEEHFAPHLLAWTAMCKRFAVEQPGVSDMRRAAEAQRAADA